MKKQALFIVNKKSGTADKSQISRQVARWIDRSLFNYDLVFTQYKGHATALSTQASQSGLDLVVAAGGDGTINEVAKGLIHTETALGILPLGSGNGLARSLEIPRSVSKAMAILNSYRLHKIDVGLIDKNPFFSNAGIGFDALVTKNFEKCKRRGLFGYLQTILRSLPHYKSSLYEININEQKHFKKAFLIHIANSNQLGYNFKIAPQAVLHDGLLDITVITGVSNRELPAIALRAMIHRLTGSKHVDHFRCKEVEICSKEIISQLQSDGDVIPFDQKKVSIQLLPQALHVVAGSSHL